MNNLTKLMIKPICLLLVSSILTACTESISEEIQNSSKAQNNSSQSFANKSIRLVNKKSSHLSYIMHKAGSVSEACEIKAPSIGFKSENYTSTSSVFALDCILDVEELDLHFEGIQFEAQVDNNLCEYIAYKPFGFMKLMAGDTSKKVYDVKCDSVCAELRPELCDKQYKTYTAFAAGAFNSATTFQNQTTGEVQCTFDYATELSSRNREYPNCDEGLITNQEITLIGIPDDPATDPANEASCTDADISASIGSSTETDCGGDHKNCLDGALALESDISIEEGKTSVIYENKDLDQFIKEWSYAGAIARAEENHNRKLSNFSRICADTSTTKALDSAFNTLSLKGYEIEKHRLALGSTIALSVDTDADGLNDYTSYADNPHRSKFNTSPYYGIYCLDKSKDVKAQIRLFVREWDKRMSPTNTYLSLASDVGTAGTVQMDARDDLQDGTFPWNDYDDWDDFLEDNSVYSNNQCNTSTTPYTKSNFPDY